MLFNSFNFIIFLPTVFLLYWFVFNKKLNLQNFFLLLASYVFYGWWDWRFLSLIFISSMVDYLVGLSLFKTDDISKRKHLLLVSIFVNIGFLGFFKYFNFFADSLVQMFSNFGISLHPRTLNIVLPVGISFYTFQTMSYTLDIYRKKMKPTNNIIAFFAFVSFFPQLVAGPIERAKNLLPQFMKKRKFDYEIATDGLRQILWGLLKKIIIADSCARVVDYVFANYQFFNGSALFLGVILFAFQIYGDFSGYSDIAIGSAKLFGFNLMRNFAYPYFSRDIAEFWRRWHISLSTWFRDYVYIPLGGSYVSKWKRIRNIIITFTVSGFWHGANWTFIFWGFLNGLYYIPIMLFNKQKIHTDTAAANRLFPSVRESLQIVATFFLTLIAWVFFRSDSIVGAFAYLSRIFSKSLFAYPHIAGMGKAELIFVIIFVIIEWVQREKEHALKIENMNKTLRWALYWAASLFLLWNFSGEKTFIYFQF